MGKLAEICCRVVAQELSWLSFAEARYIIENLPSAQCVELVWQHLCQNMKDSKTLYLLMQNHPLIAGELDSTGWYGHKISYRRQSVPNLDLVESIRFFNTLEGHANYQFLTILELQNDMPGLESLVNLPSLVELSVAGISRPEQLVTSWHRALKVDSRRWSQLKVLNVPQLTSPRLFFDSWQLIPSLLWMGVNLDGKTIGNIPKLNQLVIEAPIKAPMEILCWLQEWQTMEIDGKVMIELDVNPNLVIPSIPSYFPLEARFSKLPGTYGYMRRLTNKRTEIPEQDEVERPKTKRPKHRGIRRGASLQRFFGWGGL
ncbi:hypothetical protein ZYGR_0A00400 [Zygosaccharomyces rouxii]|uniref:ZYRO0A00858p n=2 Tax=Zygosaccharomyces rouxii TaxID=4956 RepID=C5DP68_ZYGRC|nr:uncharacterized protein ZYRO0A00858g [Zygosaccharomyces rouxii]KAH9199002.1 hypothetical protein LQ764DRAFT_145295 [Zygosaccharomyces rouxii]GAV46449.1 hypothetical protein ZYGR_0A00400 [Zygosaccharomyces rouxii]CAR25479.1 ZYRO0A00858p [Zygosaccharomyces rouxii]